MPNLHRVFPAFVAAAFAASTSLGAAATLRSAGVTQHDGIAASVTRRSDIRDLGRAPASFPMSLVATMSYRNAADLERLVAIQGNARSPFFHHFLTSAQFRAYFAPEPATYARALSALRRAGFRITRTTANRTLIDAVAPSSLVERYFGTEMHLVLQAGHGYRYANARPAFMPAELRGIVSAVSLNDLIVAHPPLHFAATAGRRILAARVRPDQTCIFGICFGASPTPTPKPTNTPTAKPTAPPTAVPTATPTPSGAPTPSASPAPTATPTATGSSAPIGGALKGPDGGYGPIAVAHGYDLPVQHGYNGTGRATGVAISGDFSETDLAGFLGYYGIVRTGPSTTRVEVDGGATYDSTFSTSNASVEATLDVETIVGNAPGTHLYMYLFPELSDQDIEDGYNQAVSDDAVDIVNSSFGGCETSDTSFDTTLDSIAQQGAAEGITFSASSGDSGSAECGTSLLGLGGSSGVAAPASVPHFVAVGGTTLTVTSTGAYSSEVAWDDSGGGTSTVFAEPSYQDGIAKSTSGRNVPDLAYTADPNSGDSLYFDGSWDGPIGGTSWASPIFCAVQTEINQRDGARAGFVNPRIYAAYTKYGYTVFHDITSGSNGSFSAAPGYDEVTGIGSTQSYAFSGVE